MTPLSEEVKVNLVSENQKEAVAKHEQDYHKAMQLSNRLAKNANKFKNQPFLLLFSIKEREEIHKRNATCLEPRLKLPMSMR